MKMMKYMTCLATAFLALVACSDADDILSAFHSDPNAVHITAEVGKASADGFTRSNPLGDAEAQKKFNTDDEISVKADGQAAVTYKFNGTEWIPQNSKFLKWESETMNFTAYYPASYTGGTPTQPTEYTTVESLATADYMSFTGSQKNTGDNKLTLTMNRQMARVVVDIASFNDQYAGATINSVNSLTIMGVKAYKHSDNKFYALMVPCKADNNAQFLSLKVGEGNTETLTGIPALEAGKSYTYDLTVGKNKVVVTGITVKDWTTDKIINGVAELDTRPYVTFKAEGTQTFKMTTEGSYTISGLEYSLNGGEWTSVVANEEVAFGGTNSTLRLRGTNPNGTAESFSNYSTINFTEDYVEVACTGDIRTLLDYRNYATVATDQARFCNLFRGCRALTTAPYLPAMVLAGYCYQGMFQNCTNLETPPALPAETLADYCYQGMFFGCTDLKTAPVLPADTLTPACYNTMFSGCINLKTAPQLPATTLAVCCYQQMFQDCKNIETAPALPAETLAGSCYQGMFQRCKNLSSVTMMAPSDQIKNAFNCCGNWLEGAGTNATSRTLKVKDEDAYNALVAKGYLPDIWKKGAEGTTVDDVPYVTFTAEGTQTFKMTTTGGYTISGLQYSVNDGEWNDVVADEEVTFGGSNGTLCLRGTNLSGTAKDDNYFSTISFTNSGVKVACTGDIRTLLDYRNYKTVDTQNAKFCNLFENCTALTFAPKLPAETLASNCYSEMFSGCTNLNTAPSLPATKLVENCYYNMFSGCTNLNTAPKLPATKLAYWCYYGMFNDCSSLTEAPILPAETLANGCYFYMFSGCKNLKTAPSLPATRLARYCYHSMFRGCTNLTSVTMLAPRDQITSKERCCDDWLNNAGTSAASRTLKVTDVDAYDALVSKGYLPADYWQKGKCSVSW